MTVVALSDVVKLSISAEFKSFLLIMCIDPPESTAISRSSSLRFHGAGRHLFSEGEKECCFVFLLSILTHFWPASTLLHRHTALAIPSIPETDPQILEHWGYADEGHLGKSFQAFSATALLSPIFLDLLLGCSSTWRCTQEHFFPTICVHSQTCGTNILEGAIFHIMNWCKFL